MLETDIDGQRRRRNPLSFGVSACLHGGVLAWVIFSGAGEPRAKSIYDQEIRPSEKKIIWYNLREKLPEISPSSAQADSRPERARVKAPQTMVSGLKDDPKPSQLIWSPEPEVAAPKEVPLPNVVAVARPKVVRQFTAPPELVAPPPVAATLPEAPQVANAAPKAVELPVVRPSGAPRAFTPPPNERMQRQAALMLPEGPAPRIVVEANALPFETVGPKPEPKKFVPPPSRGQKSGTGTAAALPVAPEVTAANVPAAGLERVPRSFTPRKGPPAPAGAPVIAAEPPAVPGAPGGTAETSLAIVGPNPARVTEVPPPPGSRAAGFSAGPVTREEGGTGANGSALVNVPGLVVKGGAKDAQPTLVATFSPTSRENLLAAARTNVPAGLAGARPPEARAARVTDAPDPRLSGRVVYSIAIQMPNVTSYSGSWLVWFAEREPVPGAAPPTIRPPEVVRKVDPKYVASAVADRVEGTIRLFAVIQKDGHVGRIALIRQLDARLDQTSQEALAKWEFTPALRNGVPVDVDAVFEIPFHLSPKLAK